MDKLKLLSVVDRLEKLRDAAPDIDDEPEPEPPTEEQLFVAALEGADTPQRFLAVPHDLALDSRAKGWAGDPWCVVFLGKVGVGKTWQATRLFGGLRQAAKKSGGRCSALWISASSAVEQIRAEIATDHDGRTLRRMLDCDLLLLDDFGAERDSDFGRDKLSLVLCHRYNHELPTILTSNLEDSQGVPSLEKVEPRLASRVGSGVVIRVAGRDRRLK